VVVEGVSAAGKTTWCRKYFPDCTIPETGTCPEAPDRLEDVSGAARFWARKNAERWTAAQMMERAGGLAVCDTDPLKLHYVWSLWQIGKVPKLVWEAECVAVRDEVAGGRLGFADIYLVKEIEPSLALQQRNADDTRSRRNFELHILLEPAVIAWYLALERLLPGRVIWGLPEDGRISFPVVVNQPVTNLEIFDRLTESLADF